MARIFNPKAPIRIGYDNLAIFFILVGHDVCPRIIKKKKTGINLRSVDGHPGELSEHRQFLADRKSTEILFLKRGGKRRVGN